MIVLKADELVQNLGFLRRGGKILLNGPEDFRLIPVVAHALEENSIPVIRVDASACAEKSGMPLAVNLVLLSMGIQDGCIPFPIEVLENAVVSVSPPKFAEGNLSAVHAGMTW
jgi:Pyruvate/2-oxoacid:ferredoxin oxidoreductase gamma subunit